MISASDKYDSDYFIRGKESGKSLYQNYRWLPSLTLPMAERIIDHLGIELDDRIMDFGCSRGYLVRALTELGHDSYGVDISGWAVANCDEAVKGKVFLVGNQPFTRPDWITAKDTLEHLTMEEVAVALASFARQANKGVFIVVPLANGFESGKYVVPEYEEDITHVIRWPLWRWVQECHLAFEDGWEVSARYRINGIKDNYSQFAKGNGFITIRRVT